MWKLQGVYRNLALSNEYAAEWEELLSRPSTVARRSQLPHSSLCQAIEVVISRALMGAPTTYTSRASHELFPEKSDLGSMRISTGKTLETCQYVLLKLDSCQMYEAAGISRPGSLC